MRTPWGNSDHEKKIADGIVFYSTPGHGGIKLSAARNAKVQALYRREDGWYEEDCDYSFVVVTFPECFKSESFTAAVASIKDYYPDAYEAVTGEKVRSEESYVMRERLAQGRKP